MDYDFWGSFELWILGWYRHATLFPRENKKALLRPTFQVSKGTTHVYGMLTPVDDRFVPLCILLHIRAVPPTRASPPPTQHCEWGRWKKKGLTQGSPVSISVGSV